ncbi:MAG: tryptophan synthase subunit beta, partial [Planctomycetota bacterium]
MTTHQAAEERGRFGAFGGRYVPETLIAALDELEAARIAANEDPAFQRELDRLLAEFVGRPTPITVAERLSAAVG